MFDGMDATGSLPLVGASAAAPRPLSDAVRGWDGVVERVGGSVSELERRLLEIGFVEGARVRVLHEGLFGRDPMAVMVDDTRIALRRREAAQILVRFDPAAPGPRSRR